MPARGSGRATSATIEATRMPSRLLSDGRFNGATSRKTNHVIRSVVHVPDPAPSLIASDKFIFGAAGFGASGSSRLAFVSAGTPDDATSGDTFAPS
ncbi:hypothetical protein AWB74_08345 [Caballeronia arvi]|uniref:Uncharacterized protein n=1 Tax=Caballeronia arvi TaxID=1777135 RepID=A0A158L4Q2_9BURK|nr:hypothetical protein AWB74_08345 [Caballeronia arvi]